MALFGRKRKERVWDGELVAVPEEEAITLLESLTPEVYKRYEEPRHEAINLALRYAVRYAVDDPIGANEDELRVGVSIANVGYSFRLVEEDVLGADSSALTEALLELRERHAEWEDWFAAVSGSASVCAQAEGLSGDQGLQWSIPGVGAQVREMFVVSTVDGMAQPSPGDTLSEVHYASCWRYGWYLRCFEAAMPGGAEF
jgi:hypothetical protein